MISVIIPVYNVQEYLDKCIESIVNQTYKELEIILVDDGSTDSSGEKCDIWAARDCRITVIHQENKGLSAARNKGLKASVGEYVCFVDSDDYLDESMYEHMLTMLEMTDAQVAICREHSFCDVSDDIEDVWKLQYKLLDRQDLLDMFTENFQGTITWAWNKLYRREIIEGIFYIEGIAMEDIFFSVEVVKRITSAAWTDNRYYHYRMRSNSIMAVRKAYVLLHHAMALKYEIDELKDLSSEEYGLLLKVQNLKKIGGLCIEAYRKKERSTYAQIKCIYKEIYAQCEKRKLDAKNRFILFIYRYFFILAAGVRRHLFRKEDKR